LKQILNNDNLYSTANELDSLLYASHIVCNYDPSGYVTRHPRPQTNLNSPESSSLESPRVFVEFGG